jgi:hypothetical protein
VTVGLPAQVALLAAVLFAGIALERATNTPAKWRALPTWQRIALGGTALTGPFVLYTTGYIRDGIVDGVTVALALSALLWLTLPELLTRLTGAQPRTGC